MDRSARESKDHMTNEEKDDMSITPIHQRIRIAAVLSALAAAALVAAAPAQAAGATSAVCVNRFTATITPGFSLTPSSGTLTTRGQTGSINCAGTLRGHRITGRGSIGFDAVYTAATCSSEVSSGTVRVTLPTSGGIKHLVGALTVRRTALVVSVGVRFPNARFSGIGVAIPTQGNCLITPMRQALITIAGSLSAA